MSLRLRLVLLILMLVALVTVTLSALQLQTLVEFFASQAQNRAELAGQQISAFLVEHVDIHANEYPVPENMLQTSALWNQIVATDPDVTAELQRTMANTIALLEINIAGSDGKILASSSPPNRGGPLKRATPFTTWVASPLYRRTLDLVQRRTPDLEVTVPMGIAGEARTIFTVQVVTSSVFLRELIAPELQRLFEVSAGAVALSLLLMLALTHRLLRPLQLIEQTIDRISQGRFQAGEAGQPGAKEFRAVQDKLNLLGQQLSLSQSGVAALATPPGGRQSLATVVERMASQLDVAARLAAISRLSGGVAHEIKNPLNAILLRLDLLRARLDGGEEPAELTGEIDILSKEVVRLDRVVKTFLDFSRPVEVKLEDLDLTTLVREVVDFVRPQAEAAHILVKDQLPELPAPMRGDADLLKQALLNLLTNAVEAMQNAAAADSSASPSTAPYSGRLSVSLGPSSGDYYSLKVSDTGPGIPEAKRDKVFQLYFTTKEKGSGIGLAMTYRAVQLHNGTIGFQTEAGKGTTFHLELPAQLPEAAPHVAP